MTQPIFEADTCRVPIQAVTANMTRSFQCLGEVPVVLLWRFCPFSGHSLPIVGVLRQLGFYEVRMSAPRPNSSLESLDIAVFFRHLSQNLSDMDIPLSRW